ncbi:hypothetical protein BCR35DRAFT_331059 [Leucosporidium creatinivorum]|uniref:MYND-type domain-containing protein n=1 Tax=Leucosporidium creatinivorum TaxID=106004 RepID=A0A1Y2FN06_9BASI|nr:hypothetical protein BCR35DRAFT_331059 [Leucosporidium creatinivorum]
MSWNVLASFGQARGLREIDMVNLSSNNATLKLMQCERLGLWQTSVRDKFYRPKAMLRAAGDLPEAQFIKYKRILEEIEQRLGENSQESWVPILYNWELYPGASKGTLDSGDFVIVNSRLDKYLLVQLYGDECNGCGKPHQDLYDQLLVETAQRFLNLTSYLHGVRTPKWIRATYTSPQEPLPSPAFFDFDNLSPARRRPTDSLVLHLTRDDLIPSLREKDCDLIDALVHSLGGFSLSRHHVLMPKDAPPPITWGREKIQRVCAGCEKMFPLDKLSRCGGCRLVFYCGAKCQQQHWSLHKRPCKASRR